MTDDNVTPITEEAPVNDEAAESPDTPKTPRWSLRAKITTAATLLGGVALGILAAGMVGAKDEETSDFPETSDVEVDDTTVD